MSQPSVASYFASRKRRASEELRAKSKVLILDEHDRKEILALIPEDQTTRAEQPAKSMTKMETKKEMAVRNLQFDLGAKKSVSKPRSTRTRRPSTHEDSRQPDIRETMLKVNKDIEDDKKVVFEKLGCLSPKKSTRSRSSRTVKANQVENTEEPAILKTPTKSSESSEKLKNMSLDDVKSKITTSARLKELRARIAKFKSCDDKLEKLNQLHKEKKDIFKKAEEKLKIKEFERIELEIPVSPQKRLQSPNKFLSPTKTIQLSPKASPARRLLFEPKETPASPVKASPTKTPAYQRYQSLVDSDIKLSLPYKYRFLAELFRSVDTVSAMFFNRKEIITFSKLKPAVQELLRRNFTLDHMAQIKKIYPDAFSFHHEKLRSFGTGNGERFELVITPLVDSNTGKSGRNTPDEDDVLKSAQETHMGPSTLLERKRKFYNELLEIVKDEHDKFLRSLDPPMIIPKEKITRWHPEFDIENCRDIEKDEISLPPTQKVASAKEMLDKASRMINDNSRMKKAIEMLAENHAKNNTPTGTTVTPDVMRNVNISIVDTPPATPKTEKPNPLLKGIPQSLLEKVRARQAAKALEMMTRSTDANKDAVMYARLPELAKILRNIFVTEKKGVLTVEHVVKKLDDSYKTKLTPSEIEKHVRIICKLLPLWATIVVVRKIDYLKLARDFDMAKVIKRLEVLADEKA